MCAFLCEHKPQGISGTSYKLRFYAPLQTKQIISDSEAFFSINLDLVLKNKCNTRKIKQYKNAVILSRLQAITKSEENVGFIEHGYIEVSATSSTQYESSYSLWLGKQCFSYMTLNQLSTVTRTSLNCQWKTSSRCSESNKLAMVKHS